MVKGPIEIGPPSALATRWAAIGVFLTLAALAFWTHASYLTLPHAHDDRYIQLLSGLKMTGRLGWEYLLRPYEGHFLPLWRLVYHAQLRLCGVEPRPWHAVILLSQTVSAFFIWRLLLRYLRDGVAAFVGAALWAAASIGRWDNPLSWLAAGLNVHALALLLAAMLCLARYADVRRGRWLVAMAGCMTLATLMSGPMLVLSLVLPAQMILLERLSWRTRAGAPALVVWFATGLLLAIVETIAVSIAGLPRTVGADTALNLPALMQIVSSQMFVALTHLCGFGPWPTTHWPAVVARVAMCVGLFAAFCLPGLNRRVLLIFGGLGLLHLLAAAAFRGALPAEAALGWGRYLYMSTLAWAVFAATLVAAARHSVVAGPGRIALSIVLLLIAAYPIIAQRPLAASAAAELRRVTADEQSQIAANVARLKLLESYAASRQAILRVLDIPLDVPPARDTYYPLSVFAAVNLPGELPHLQIITLDGWTEDDGLSWQRSFENNPAFNSWAADTTTLSEWGFDIRGLESDARSSQTVLTIPNVQFDLPPRRFPLQQVFAFEFAGSCPSLRIVAVGEKSPQEWRAEGKRLPAFWQFWHDVFEQAAQESMPAQPRP